MKKDRERKAKRNAERTREETDLTNERNRIAMDRFKQNLTEEQKDGIRRSDRIRKQQEREDMSEDQAAEATERHRQIMETHRRVKKSKVTLKDGLRSQEVLAGTFSVQKLEDSFDAIGKMDVKCQECGAFKFKRETPGLCC